MPKTILQEKMDDHGKVEYYLETQSFKDSGGTGFFTEIKPHLNDEQIDDLEVLGGIAVTMAGAEHTATIFDSTVIEGLHERAYGHHRSAQLSEDEVGRILIDFVLEQHNN